MSLVAATAATRSPAHKRLVVTDMGPLRSLRATDLARVLRAGDALVYNNSSVLPARFPVLHPLTRARLEIRLARFAQTPFTASAAPGSELRRPYSLWQAVIWEGYAWRERTETRKPVHDLQPGTVLAVADEAQAKVRIMRSDRLGLHVIALETGNEEPLTFLLRRGEPVQYSHLSETLSLWDVQTLFAGPALSLEPPSAAFVLDWETVARLRDRGVEILPISHTAGLASLGSARIDRLLPLPEWSHVPPTTAEALHAVKRSGRRVIALGTTVARSLETAARRSTTAPGMPPQLMPGSFETRLRLGPHQKALYCDALVTGLHEETASHFTLEQAFISREKALEANRLAAAQGLRHHEFGDFHYLEAQTRRGGPALSTLKLKRDEYH